MARSLRRQPLVQKPPSKGPSFRPSGKRPQSKAQQAAATSPEVRAKRSFIERIPLIGRPAQDIVSELKKVTWPTRQETTRLAIAIIVVAVAIGMALGAVDLGFNWLVENTLLER
jgi:preprotein translocase subunit SecE